MIVADTKTDRKRDRKREIQRATTNNNKEPCMSHSARSRAHNTYSAAFKFNPSVVKSQPRASVFKSGSVIRITPNNPIKPNRSADSAAAAAAAAEAERGTAPVVEGGPCGGWEEDGCCCCCCCCSWSRGCCNGSDG